jgi:hypothetical protein
MAAPGSERATRRWLVETRGLGELLDVDFEAMNPMRFYRPSDALLCHRATLEQTLFARVSEFFGLDWMVTLYDLTNAFFEGEAAANPRAKHGHSKEKRSDCPLVTLGLTLGLVLDGSGFVRRSAVFDGNVAEGTTLAGMVAGLGAPAGALVVMDRGMATEENLVWLRAGLSRSGGEPGAAAPIRCGRGDLDPNRRRDRVAVQCVLDAEGGDVRLYCCSERRAHKEDGIAERFSRRFEAAPQTLHEGLARPRTTKHIATPWERIGRLKKKSHGVGQHSRITVEPDAGGVNARAIRWERQPVEGTLLTHRGVYCLHTNELTWDSEQLWRTDVMLTDLEAVFRALKSELGLRPAHHQRSERAEGHLLITVLAYQFVQIIRRRLQAHGIPERWFSLRAILAGQCRVTATFRRPDGRALHVRTATQPEPAQLAIIRALGSHPTPGGVHKLSV